MWLSLDAALPHPAFLSLRSTAHLKRIARSKNPSGRGPMILGASLRQSCARGERSYFGLEPTSSRGDTTWARVIGLSGINPATELRGRGIRIAIDSGVDYNYNLCLTCPYGSTVGIRSQTTSARTTITFMERRSRAWSPRLRLRLRSFRLRSSIPGALLGLGRSGRLFTKR